MKKSFLSLLLIAGLVTSAFAQKTINDANAQKRTVGSFRGIEVGTGIELTLTKGTTEDVAVSASEAEFRDKIVTEVVNGILKIHYETKTGAINKRKENKDLKAYVSYKSLDVLHVTTGADVKIEGVLEATTLDLKANTGGLVTGDVNIGTLNVDQNTGSRITLTGKVDKLDAEGDTGSKFMGEDLSANTCSVEMSTGAGIYISVDKELNVKANTGGYVKYKGNAGIREVKTNTGGNVSKNLKSIAMQKLFSILLFTAFITSASAQKTINDANAQKRNVPGFHAIEVSGGIDLYLSQGDEAVAVSASTNEYRDKVITEVKDGVLKIYFEWKNNLKVDWKNRKLKAYVSVKNLDGLEASGGSDVTVDGTIKTTKLNMEISGGSDFKGKIEAEELKINASGGSDVSISGKAARLTIDANGGSDFNGYDFASDICNVEASGGSDVEITVNKELSANASGGSDIHYKGTGLIRDIKTGGGSIKKVSK